MLRVAHAVNKLAVTKKVWSTPKLPSQAFSRPLQAQGTQALAKSYASRTEPQNTNSGICKVLSTSTADELLRDSEVFLDEMRRFLTTQKEGEYWDMEASHMEEDDLLERFMDAICEKQVSYEDIVIIAKTFERHSELTV